MRKFLKSTFIMLALGVVSTPMTAHAQDAFSGLYGGIAVSSGFNGQSIVTDGLYDFDLKGSHITLLGGYSFQAGSFVYGMEGDANFGKIKDAQSPTFFGVTYNGKAALENFYTIRARAGFAPTESLLFFASAGPAWTTLSASTIVTGAPLGPLSPFKAIDQSKSVTGYVLGLGGEYQFSNNIAGRLDYSELFFNKVDFLQRNPGGPDTIVRSDNSAAFVRGGVVFKY